MPIIVLIVCLCLSWSATAQVTIDLRALDALPLPGSQPRPRSAPPPPRTGSAAVAPTRPPSSAPSAPASASVAPAPAPTTRDVTLPIVTPPAADLAPIPPAPLAAAAPPPPPPPPISATSTTRATEAPAGMRLTFEPAASDLSAASVEALKRFIGSTPGGEATSFNVLAYAAGKTEDPSVARRLSLSRALAVRSALIAEGIASSRIFVRALGSQAGGGPPDRVDISLLGTNAAP